MLIPTHCAKLLAVEPGASRDPSNPSPVKVLWVGLVLVHRCSYGLVYYWCKRAVEADPGGAWPVERAPLSEKVLVPKAVAEAFEVSERSQEPLAAESY